MEITFDNTNKWALSVGTGFLIISLFWNYFSTIFNIPIGSIFSNTFQITFFFGGMILITIAVHNMIEIELTKIRYEEELIISEIIKQGILLLDLKLKEIQYHKESGIKIHHRKEIKDFVRQAFNPTFYEDTYGIKKNKIKNLFIEKMKMWFKRNFKKN